MCSKKDIQQKKNRETPEKRWIWSISFRYAQQLTSNSTMAFAFAVQWKIDGCIAFQSFLFPFVNRNRVLSLYFFSGSSHIKPLYIVKRTWNSKCFYSKWFLVFHEKRFKTFDMLTFIDFISESSKIHCDSNRHLKKMIFILIAWEMGLNCCPFSI